jgi:hypothetical protein
MRSMNSEKNVPVVFSNGFSRKKKFVTTDTGKLIDVMTIHNKKTTLKCIDRLNNNYFDNGAHLISFLKILMLPSIKNPMNNFLFY